VSAGASPVGPVRPWAAAAAAAALALAACGKAANKPPEAGDQPAARVAGETIWVSDVKRQAVSEGALNEGEALDPASETFRKALDEAIDQKLLAREAERLRLDKDAVAQHRLAAARDKTLGDILVESVVDRAVNENAIRSLYQEQQKLSAKSEELRARQILTPTQADADAVKKLLETGAAFETLALQRSTDQATRFNGGDLGYFTLDAMPKAYQDALKAAQKGQLVGPFETNAGWALVQVEDRRPQQPISLEEARPQIVRFLTYDEIRSLLARLRQGSKVEVLMGRQGAPQAAPPPAPATAAPAVVAPIAPKASGTR
jgi:peptidyl-prolyl cis-trans isomerase C